MSMDPTHLMKWTPFPSVKDFFENTLSTLHWETGADESALDVGCGPGQSTKQLILPKFPRLRRIYATDLQPEMIRIAKAHNQHSKIQYSVSDIENWNSVSQWEDGISKMFAIHSVQWMTDQRLAFTNMHRLLKPGGRLVVFMILQSQFFETVLHISRDSKWKEFIGDVDNHVAKSHTEKYRASHYENMLENMGFSVLLMDERLRIDAFPSDFIYKNLFASICVLVSHIPVHRREEFKEDLFQRLLKTCGRTNKGLPKHEGKTLEFVLQKQ